MSDLKLKVIYGNFNFEIEGESSDVKKVFEDIKSDVVSKLIQASGKVPMAAAECKDGYDSVTDTTPAISGGASNTTKTSTARAKSGTGLSRAKQPVMLTEFGLNKEQFADFKARFDSYNIKSATTAVLIVFFLYKEITGNNEFSLDLTFTLLRMLKVNVPKVLSQTLIDIRNKRRYVQRNDDGTWMLHYTGEQFVEGLGTDA